MFKEVKARERALTVCVQRVCARELRRTWQLLVGAELGGRLSFAQLASSLEGDLRRGDNASGRLFSHALLPGWLDPLQGPLASHQPVLPFSCTWHIRSCFPTPCLGGLWPGPQKASEFPGQEVEGVGVLGFLYSNVLGMGRGAQCG